MHRLRFIIVFIIILPLLSGCHKESYTEISLEKPSRHSKSSGGAYTKVISKSSNMTVSGELVFLDDTLILYTDRQQFVAIPVHDIETMTAQLTGTKAKTYLLITGLTLVPTLVGLLAHSKHSDSPKAIGLMATSPGLLVALIESFKKPQLINYPEDSLDEFKQHARYPDTLPFEPKFQDLLSSARVDRDKLGLESMPMTSTNGSKSHLSIKKR
ncbi:MAG: hypothetical protein RLO17_08765 [Cyclobacteriaceae bacterium]